MADIPRADTPLVFRYTNYKGETETRRVIPDRVWFGNTPWHPENQWMMSGFDLDKQAERNFAMRDMVQS